jgi:hypothetical protein
MNHVNENRMKKLRANAKRSQLKKFYLDGLDGLEASATEDLLESLGVSFVCYPDQDTFDLYNIEFTCLMKDSDYIFHRLNNQ